jgi:hypothetical protein
MTARPLHKADELRRCQERIRRLEGMLAKEKQARLNAEGNARRFHAMMLKARIELIQAGGPK